jgi:hypothetical protein
LKPFQLSPAQRRAALFIAFQALPALAVPGWGLAAFIPATASAAATVEAAAGVAEARPKAPTITIDPELSWSTDAARVVAWVRQSRDNGKLPFIVIDKPTASLLLFNASGKALGRAPVLLGIGVGDQATPGVGGKKLAEIGPAERTTPAGRFVAKFGRAVGAQRVLWVDWNTSVALHPVITTNKKERRLQRLLSPDPADNRISFGCINVPTKFYRDKVQPLLRRNGGMVYVLPDVTPVEEVFPRLRLQRFETTPGQLVLPAPSATPTDAPAITVEPVPPADAPARPRPKSAPRQR